MSDLSHPGALRGGRADLPHWGSIVASGEDRADFLHRQTTQDFKQLPEGRARMAGLCSAKGRLQASFVAWSEGEQIRLACSRDLADSTLARLSKFILRSRCKLAAGSESIQGLAGPDAGLALAGLGVDPAIAEWGTARVGGARVVRLPAAAGLARWLWVGEQAPDLPAMSASAWDALEAESACVRVCAATFEAFVPQMVNLERVGGVDFRKGCYPGQEVVARSQYRGTLKRGGRLFETMADAAPGDPIFHSDDPDQPAGMVANAGRVSPQLPARVFAEIKLAALAQGSIHLRDPGGPRLSLLDLPYPAPIAEEA